MEADNASFSAKSRPQVAAWCLLASAMLLLSVLLFRMLPYVPDAHPTHASEVVPRIPRLSAADIQRPEGTLHGPSASVRFVLIMGAQFLLWGLMLRTARGMSQKMAAQAGLITGTLLLVAQLGSAAMLSSDVYAYITHGRALALHHV